MATKTPPGTSTVTQRSQIVSRFGLMESSLNSGHDYSYSEDDGESYERGGRAYYPPFGFDKLGIRLASTNFMDATSGWHVAYHGTQPASVPLIVSQGLRVQGGQLTAPTGSAYGVGIYCSFLSQWEHFTLFGFLIWSLCKRLSFLFLRGWRTKALPRLQLLELMPGRGVLREPRQTCCSWCASARVDIESLLLTSG